MTPQQTLVTAALAAISTKLTLTKDDLEKVRKSSKSKLTGSDLADMVKAIGKLTRANLEAYVGVKAQPSTAPVVKPVPPVDVPQAAFPITGPYKTDKLGAITCWGMKGEPQSAEKPYSLNYSNGILRVEARHGDRRQKASEITRDIERSEVSFPENPFEFGVKYRATLGVMFEPGSPMTGANDKFLQIHNVNDAGDASLGPVFAMQLEKERLRIVCRADEHRNTTGRVEDKWLYEGRSSVQRGHWYNLDLELLFDPFGHGLASVKMDDEIIALYAGPLGYNDAKPPYIKLGIYRDSKPETVARQYRDLKITKE